MFVQLIKPFAIFTGLLLAFLLLATILASFLKRKSVKHFLKYTAGTLIFIIAVVAFIKMLF